MIKLKNLIAVILTVTLTSAMCVRTTVCASDEESAAIGIASITSSVQPYSWTDGTKSDNKLASGESFTTAFDGLYNSAISWDASASTAGVVLEVALNELSRVSRIDIYVAVSTCTDHTTRKNSKYTAVPVTATALAYSADSWSLASEIEYSNSGTLSEAVYADNDMSATCKAEDLDVVSVDIDDILCTELSLTLAAVGAKRNDDGTHTDATGSNITTRMCVAEIVVYGDSDILRTDGTVNCTVELNKPSGADNNEEALLDDDSDNKGASITRLVVDRPELGEKATELIFRLDGVYRISAFRANEYWQSQFQNQTTFDDVDLYVGNTNGASTEWTQLADGIKFNSEEKSAGHSENIICGSTVAVGDSFKMVINGTEHDEKQEYTNSSGNAAVLSFTNNALTDAALYGTKLSDINNGSVMRKCTVKSTVKYNTYPCVMKNADKIVLTPEYAGNAPEAVTAAAYNSAGELVGVAVGNSKAEITLSISSGCEVSFIKLFGWSDVENTVAPVSTTYTRFGVTAKLEAADDQPAQVEDASAIAAQSLCMCVDSDNALVSGVWEKTPTENITARIVNDLVFVPAEFFAQSIGAVFKSEDISVTVAKGGQTAEFAVSADETVTDDQLVGAYNIDGTLYVPAAELCDALDLYLFSDSGLIICSETNWDLSWSEHIDELRTICESFVFDEVSGAQIYADVTANWSYGEHPRLLFTQERFDSIKAELTKGDECDQIYQKLYKRLVSKCNSYLDTDPYEYEFTDGVRLMQTADKMQTRFLSLALLYNITGIEEYAERAWVEILAACSFKDWHPWHFLDTGIMSSGIGLAYDWLYNWMTEEQRETVREAIMTHGITQVINDYNGKAVSGKDNGDLLNRSSLWAYTGGNWQFAAGGGVGTAALAICTELDGEELEQAQFVMEQGLVTLRKGLTDFAPDGAYEDGVNYWGFATQYFGRYIGSLLSSAGKSYGYLDCPGLSKTLDWHMATNGPVNNYAFHDNEYTSSTTNYNYMIWATLMNQPQKGKAHADNIIAVSGSAYQDFMWYDPSMSVSDDDTALSLDMFSESIGVVSSRNSWSSSATWLGFHADNGLHKPSHMHMDGGSFAIQSQGENFFFDLGSDDYTLPNYRVTAYRCRAEGHNGIVLNPGKGQYGDYDMQYDGNCKIDKYVSKPQGMLALANVTDLWREDLKEGWRGVKFDNFRRTITVQDELVMKEPSEFYWFAHTEGTIQISEDGKTALITVNGKSMIAEIVEGEGATFSVMEAKPLPTSPACIGQDPNAGVSKLTIHMTDVSSLNLTVVFNVYDESFDSLEYSKQFVPMAEWTIPDGENNENPS